MDEPLLHFDLTKLITGVIISCSLNRKSRVSLLLILKDAIAHRFLRQPDFKSSPREQQETRSSRLDRTAPASPVQSP